MNYLLKREHQVQIHDLLEMFFCYFTDTGFLGVALTIDLTMQTILLAAGSQNLGFLQRINADYRNRISTSHSIIRS